MINKLNDPGDNFILDPEKYFESQIKRYNDIRVESELHRECIDFIVSYYFRRNGTKYTRACTKQIAREKMAVLIIRLKFYFER